MTERPLTETMYCTSMRCDSSRCVRETGLRKLSQQGTREKCLYVHLRTYTQFKKLTTAAGEQLSADTQPTLWTGPMPPAWAGALLYVHRAVFLGLTSIGWLALRL